MSFASEYPVLINSVIFAYQEQSETKTTTMTQNKKKYSKGKKRSK